VMIGAIYMIENRFIILPFRDQHKL